jgi:hypothetical protein
MYAHYKSALSRISMTEDAILNGVGHSAGRALHALQKLRQAELAHAELLRAKLEEEERAKRLLEEEARLAEERKLQEAKDADERQYRKYRLEIDGPLSNDFEPKMPNIHIWCAWVKDNIGLVSKKTHALRLQGQARMYIIAITKLVRASKFPGIRSYQDLVAKRPDNRFTEMALSFKIAHTTVTERLKAIERGEVQDPYFSLAEDSVLLHSIMLPKLSREIQNLSAGALSAGSCDLVATYLVGEDPVAGNPPTGIYDALALARSCNPDALREVVWESMTPTQHAKCSNDYEYSREPIFRFDGHQMFVSTLSSSVITSLSQEKLFPLTSANIYYFKKARPFLEVFSWLWEPYIRRAEAVSNTHCFALEAPVPTVEQPKVAPPKLFPEQARPAQTESPRMETKEDYPPLSSHSIGDHGPVHIRASGVGGLLRVPAQGRGSQRRVLHRPEKGRRRP